MIKFTPIEKSKAHVALASVWPDQNEDGPNLRARQAWAWQITHLDVRDVAENLANAEHLLELISESGTISDTFCVDLREVKQVLNVNETRAMQALSLLGCREHSENPFLFENISGAPRMMLATASDI